MDTESINSETVEETETSTDTDIENKSTDKDEALEILKTKSEFLKELRSSKTKLDKLLKQAGNITIMGKTMDEWKKLFHIPISSNPSMDEVYASLAKTNSYISYVNHKLAVAEIARDSIKREMDDKHAKLFISLKKKKEMVRALSNEHINLQITSTLSDENNQLMLADYVVRFWENRRQQLISTRKILETIAYGLSSEMRMRTTVNHVDQHSPEDSEEPSFSRRSMFD